MRENGGACHMDGQNISKMAHDGGDSRSRAPFLEYLGACAVRLTPRDGL